MKIKLSANEILSIIGIFEVSVIQLKKEATAYSLLTGKTQRYVKMVESLSNKLSEQLNRKG